MKIAADQRPDWTYGLCSARTYHDASRLYELADGRRFVLPLVGRGSRGSSLKVLGSHFDGCGIGGLVGADLDDDAVTAIAGDLAAIGAVQTRVRPNPVHEAR